MRMAESRGNGRYHNPNDSDVDIRKVVEWGGSLGVTIPADAVEEWGISPDDQIGVRVADDGCVELVPDGGSDAQ